MRRTGKSVQAQYWRLQHDELGIDYFYQHINQYSIWCSGGYRTIFLSKSVRRSWEGACQAGARKRQQCTYLGVFQAMNEINEQMLTALELLLARYVEVAPDPEHDGEVQLARAVVASAKDAGHE